MPVQSLPFKNLIPINRNSSTAVFRQLTNGFIQLIRDGLLKPGTLLPSSRALAESMHMNRTTIVSAYEELRIQGWIEVASRKGIMVSSQLPLLKPRNFKDGQSPSGSFNRQSSFFRIITDAHRGIVDSRSYELIVNDGFPDARIAPLQMIASNYKTLLKRSYKHGVFLNGGNTGNALLTRELTKFLSQTRGLSIDEDNILVTRGAQIAIYIAAGMILKPGSRVMVAELNYKLANSVFEQFGATLIKVRIDENGIDVDHIEEICKLGTPDLLYIVPHHHHPTTVTLSATRRMKLLDIIRDYQLPVIEDDYDYDFHYDNCPILPLASADHRGYVMYIGSITKTLAPTIRYGYLVGNNELIWQARKFKELMEIRGDFIMEEAIATLFSTGEMQRHLHRSVKLYKARRDFFCNLLKTELSGIVSFEIPLGGMAVWTLFNANYSLTRVSGQLATKGIYMNDGTLYDQNSKNRNGLRLGFASMNETELARFVEALAKLR